MEEINAEHGKAVDRGDLEQVCMLNNDFHREIYLACNNQCLANVIERLWIQTLGMRCYAIGDPQLLKRSRKEHAEIISHLRSGNREAFVRLCVEHIWPSLEAYKRALSTDPVSAFGGIVAFNQKVDAETAKAVIEVFSEVIVAPEYDNEALEIFRSKKNLRILQLQGQRPKTQGQQLEYKQISGGFLVQDQDTHVLNPAELNIVTKRQPTTAELHAMQLAWTVCKHVKSNAIVFANEHQTLGVGAGQMNRVDSVRIAAMRAERFYLSLKGTALASDAFFPFRDNVDEAAKFGVSAIIQPGGSIKDEESIAAANEHGIAMAFTGIRHFKH